MSEAQPRLSSTACSLMVNSPWRRNAMGPLQHTQRACLETQKLEQLESRMDEIADRMARDRTNAAHKEIHP